LSLFALLLAVLPRYRSGTWAPGRPLCYFADIQQAVREGQLATALADTDRDPMAGLTAALAETSRIAARQHPSIRTGLIASLPRLSHHTRHRPPRCRTSAPLPPTTSTTATSAHASTSPPISGAPTPPR